MTAYLVRLMVYISVIFSAMLLLIHAQPVDEYNSWQPFMPDRCSAACFVGIQAGVTSVDEALKLLKTSDWINKIDNRTVNNVSGYISWNWSDHKPGWINGYIDGEIWATQKQIVQIMIYGDLQLGSTRLALGMPDQEVIDRVADRTGKFSLYTAFYSRAGLMIQSWEPCNVVEPLRRPVILTYMVQSDPILFPQRDALTDLYHTCAYPRP